MLSMGDQVDIKSSRTSGTARACSPSSRAPSSRDFILHPVLVPRFPKCESSPLTKSKRDKPQLTIFPDQNATRKVGVMEILQLEKSPGRGCRTPGASQERKTTKVLTYQGRELSEEVKAIATPSQILKSHLRKGRSILTVSSDKILPEDNATAESQKIPKPSASHVDRASCPGIIPNSIQSAESQGRADVSETSVVRPNYPNEQSTCISSEKLDIPESSAVPTRREVMLNMGMRGMTLPSDSPKMECTSASLDLILDSDAAITASKHRSHSVASMPESPPGRATSLDKLDMLQLEDPVCDRNQDLEIESKGSQNNATLAELGVKVNVQERIKIFSQPGDSVEQLTTQEKNRKSSGMKPPLELKSEPYLGSPFEDLLSKFDQPSVKRNYSLDSDSCEKKSCGDDLKRKDESQTRDISVSSPRKKILSVRDELFSMDQPLCSTPEFLVEVMVNTPLSERIERLKSPLNLPTLPRFQSGSSGRCLRDPRCRVSGKRALKSDDPHTSSSPERPKLVSHDILLHQSETMESRNSALSDDEEFERVYQCNLSWLQQVR